MALSERPVVVIGAGAAGGVVAKELSSTGFSVVVLEQGADETQICAATRLTREELRARHRLHTLAPALWTALKSGAIRATVARVEWAAVGGTTPEPLRTRLRRSPTRRGRCGCPTSG